MFQCRIRLRSKNKTLHMFSSNAFSALQFLPVSILKNVLNIYSGCCGNGIERVTEILLSNCIVYNAFTPTRNALD